MTYNRYGSNVVNDKASAYSKNWLTSTPRTFLSTYDTHIHLSRNGIDRSTYNSSSNIRYAKDDTLIRTNGLTTRKSLHSHSSSIITVPRIQPSYVSSNRLSYQHLLNQIAQITDSVFLSSLNAITIERIRELGITMLVSLITDPIPVRASNLENVVIPIEDSEYSNLRSHLDRVIDKMHREEIRGGKILVHCFAGVSRSSSLVIAYLMKYHAMRLRQAYNHVRARRPYIQPNIGFWKQLIEFEKRLFGSASVRLLPNGDGTSVSPDVPPSALASVMYNNSQKYSMAKRY